ncbi:hypothetical protein LIER_10113 [Lithospermum erythrorhizon]|uniref:Disease resistance N-terminal domain-containing protein n=1 Tax=Lithospermum erythrorhizon TaxID=34254 RepID=A0AAV3PKF7_LITER
MAEAIVKIVREQVISAAADWLKEEIFANVEKEVDNISSKMQMIQKVLDDAANRSVTDDAIKEWLEKLKDISYELEDVLDEWNTNALKHKNEEVEHNA